MSDCENVSDHNISEDSDDISETDKIIRERSKIFRNEKEAIKIFLSEHYRKFRFDFFSQVKKTSKSLYQAIKQAIRNCLNPYRIFIKEEKIENEKELKALYEELKRYYKEKNFNNTFFINYFNDLKKAHRNKTKSKFINFLPKNEEEALNDIHRKVMVIKSLKKYLTGNIMNRLQQNFVDKNQETTNKDEFIMIYKYLVLKREKFFSMKEKECFDYISNQKGKDSFKLRRPLNDIGEYNYIPILCKGHCKQESDFFIQILEKEIYKNHSDCKECKYIKDNFNDIKSQISSLYLKTCIFSHNINEIMFHPLFFFSLENIPFYIKELKNEIDNPDIQGLVETSQIPNKYFGIENYKLRKIYKENESAMKEIIKLLKEYSIKSNLFGGSCFLPDFKTKKCPLDLIKPSKNDWNNHLIKCPCYHNNLEKRRIIKIHENKICPHALNGNQWKTDKEKIDCKFGENCDKFHTRNELFYDQRNFGKLYPCIDYYQKNKYKFCKKFGMCPRKHPVDIKIDEIYLPEDYKYELKRELDKLKNKNSQIIKRIETAKKIECRCCLNYIDGENGRELIFFNNCNHIICSKCFEICKLCPLCDMKKTGSNIIRIKLVINDNNDDNQEEEEEEEDEEYENDEDDNNNSYNNSMKKSTEDEEENDEDVSDSEINNGFEINDNKNNCYSYHSSRFKDEESLEKSKNIENENCENENSNSQSSYSYSQYSGGRGRGNIRGRGIERGRGRDIRSRRIRGRGRGRGRGY